MTKSYPKIISRELLYETPYNKIYKVKADFDSFTKEYFVTESGQKAGVVLVHKKSILLVSQYRLLTNQQSLEIPGGSIDEGENPEEGAIRECLEETGIKCNSLKSLLSYQQGMDAFHTLTHLFYTEDFSKLVNFSPCAKEIESIEWTPLNRCIEMITSGVIVDSFTIIALLSYNLKLNNFKDLHK